MRRGRRRRRAEEPQKIPRWVAVPMVTVGMFIFIFFDILILLQFFGWEYA
jgi:hypothetical protein